MVWGLTSPSSFGECFPNGDFVGWDEAIKRYFDENMSPEVRARYDDWHVNYKGEISQKFIREADPLAEHECPKEFRTMETRKSLGSLIETENQLLAIDTTLKDIIDSLEPGVHQFWPMKIATAKGKDYPGAYHGLIIRRFIDGLVPEQSKGFRAGSSSDSYSAGRDSKDGYAGLAISREAVGGAHLWRELRLWSPAILMSDTLQAEIAARGLRIFKHYRLTSI